MKYVFHQSPVSPDKVALSVSKGGARELIKKGVIDTTTPYVEKDYVEPEDMTSEMFLLIYNLDCVKFDNPKKPKDVVLNKDVALLEHLTYIREKRQEILSHLDNLQLRFLAKGETLKVEKVEEDKETLRGLPSLFNTKSFSSLTDLHAMIPTELLVNYEEKYKEE